MYVNEVDRSYNNMSTRKRVQELFYETTSYQKIYNERHIIVFCMIVESMETIQVSKDTRDLLHAVETIV
jgi:ABC-type Na+ transport system ATPase subunit NatA